MNIFESIADRRIQAVRAAGMFDNLPGAGKPIPDLDQQLPPGWWATRLVRRERSMFKAEELDREVRAAMPGLWRLESEVAVRASVNDLNQSIDGYNRVTTWEPRARLDEDEVVGQWHRIRQDRITRGRVG